MESYTGGTRRALGYLVASREDSFLLSSTNQIKVLFLIEYAHQKTPRYETIKLFTVKDVECFNMFVSARKKRDY